MSAAGCPFCDVAPDRTFYAGGLVLGLWDAFPVSPGHALLVTRRHVPTWFDATPGEQAELLRAVTAARAMIERQHAPDGYNIGVNIGAAAGQTVPHLHVHVIPRYEGDVADPRFGVRRVIPGRARYPGEAGTARLPGGPPHARALVRGSESDPLLPHLVSNLDGAVSVDIAVAFTLESGVRLIEEHLRDVLDRGGRVRFVTGDYLGVTEPAALLRLLDLPGNVQLRVFESHGTSFHPKAYVVVDGDGAGSAFVGSSNLSALALRRGVEWNYRVITSRDEAGFDDVVHAFDALFEHPWTRPLDAEWVHRYAERRSQPAARAAGIEPEPVGPPPAPHEIQRRALEALETTRAEGNTAGLVVLATGLGKTWLSAFDSDRETFRRILFVAHREEILAQAMRTFRSIRPMATLGLYTGAEKVPDADVLFASIQTLGRRRNMRRFRPRDFDYVIVDEFHHAAAPSYRRLITYLEPKFLLGLTATPERTDGADLLSLCGGNVVYRCDLDDGIRRGLLAPFSYFGVPDLVDYGNIPWRSSRFDEEELTAHVATRVRAQNALEQLGRYGGQRTIGFCVSQRHADFMAEFFREAGLRAVAVHAGSSSAPRAHSLEQLEAGELDAVFAVDMFNEGVDLPHVDTILMLRPTESRILWLQQFGRGLRFRPGKTLNVIDYIGNHRVFLTKARALFGLGSADREVAYALERLDAGTLELPPGCSVTYQLEAKDILHSLIRTTGAEDNLRRYYEEFRERNGVRPLAAEAFEDGFNPRAARRAGQGSWFDLVQALGDLEPGQRQVREHIGPLLQQLEITPMSRSYKMLVLLAMLGEDQVPGAIDLARLAERFAELARRYAPLRNELGSALEDPAALHRLLEVNPITAWTGGAGTGGVAYFRYDDGELSTAFTLPDSLREPAQDMIRELAEWRLAEYLRRRFAPAGADRFPCRVSHAGGRPILFLPDRDRYPGIPEGWTDVLVDSDIHQANFVKVAVNVVTRPGSRENVLPGILRRWFGPTAGQPGRTDTVVFERRGEAYTMVPAQGDAAWADGPVPWRRFSRAEAADALGIQFRGREAQQGIVDRPERLYLFVTLDKSQMAEAHRYRDRFLSPAEFEWQSQNRTGQESTLGQKIIHHEDMGIEVHLLVRRSAKVRGKTQPFVYCGTLVGERFEGEKPITVRWRLKDPVPERLWNELNVKHGRDEDG